MVDLEKVNKLIRYFCMMKDEERLFEPEYITAMKISIVLKKGTINDTDLQFILDSLTWIEKEKHYGGSAWNEFMNIVNNVLDNYQSKILIED